MSVNQDLVTELYIGYYNRAPDPAGLQFWLNALAGGETLTQVANQFAQSSESTAIYPYLSFPGVVSPSTFVTQVYNNVLNRAPDAAGLAFWTAQLTSGSVTPGSFIVTLEASVNMQSGTADALTLSNKVVVGDDYVNRISAANVPFSQTSSHAVLAPVTSDPTTVTAAEALTTAYVGTGNASAPAQVFQLTAGTDSFTGGAGNDIFNAQPVVGANLNTVPSFTALDQLNGGGGTDTLNIVTIGNFNVPASVSVSNIEIVNVTASGAVGGDFSTFTGVTNLNVTESGGTVGTINAGSTAAIVITDAALAGNSIAVTGGASTTINASNVTGGGIINVGTTALPSAGAIAVNETVAPTATTTIADQIVVTGGTTDTVIATLTGATNNTITGGTITVNGSAATTTVTVNQTAAATASAAVAAVPGVSNTVAAVAAAPGVQPVTATTATKAVAAKAAVSGVVDGAVTISDVNAASATLANTITSVSLTNFGNGSLIKDNALSTLSLTGGTGTLTLTNAASAPTNSALALTLTGVGSLKNGPVSFVDTNNEVKTLNVTTAGTDSFLTVTDGKLSALNVAGTNVLTLSTVPTSIATIAISGGAGFNDSGTLSADAALTSFTTTSSGKITATIDATKTSFIGSTGQDVITISADATKVITGGSATGNELILNAAATTFNATAAHLTNTNVTGFTTLGFGVNATGAATFDMSTFNAGFNAFDVTSANTAAGDTVTIIKAATGASLNIAANTTGTADAGAVSLSYVDTTGTTDTTALTIGNVVETGNFSIASLTLQDANAVGIGTVNVTSNGSDLLVLGGALNTITTLVDNGLSVLNVSGAAGLTIGTLNEATHQATSFTINSMESGQNGTTIGQLTDSNLGTIVFSGTNSGTIHDLEVSGGTVTNLAISNTGTGTALVGDTVGLVDDILTTLTLSGNVNLTTGTLKAQVGGVSGASFTLSGATDNAHVTVALTGAAAGNTDTISLGNANDSITDASTAGHVTITAGTGANLIDLHTGSASTYLANVTLAAHTSTATVFDNILVGTVQAGTVTPNTIITGSAVNDQLGIAGTTAAAQASTAIQTQITNANTLNAAINIADTGLAAHQAIGFQFQGNTYVLESAAAGTGTLATGDALVELAGVHTIGFVSAGHVGILT